MFLTKFGASIWSLDNQYHTPLEEAASRGQLECVHYLDHVTAEQMLHHKASVSKQKTEAEKLARKRMKKVQREQKKRDKEYVRRFEIDNGVSMKKNKKHMTKDMGRNEQNNYIYGTSRDGFDTMNSTQSLRRFSQITRLKLGKGTTRSAPVDKSNITKGSVRQTFLAPRLRSSSTYVVNNSKSQSLTNLDSANVIFKPKAIRPASSSVFEIPEEQSGRFSSDNFAKVQTYVDNVEKYGSMSSYNSHNSTFPSSQDSCTSSWSVNSDIETIIDAENHVEISDLHFASLTTFLASLNLEQFTLTMKKEGIDMNSLALCTDDDLKSVGLPLGPRKLILEAFQKRKKANDDPGPLVDTYL